MWSVASSALLHGCTVLFALIAATLLGLIGQLDGLLHGWLSGMIGESYEQTLPGFIQWPMTIMIAFGLPLLLLCCDHAWQRYTLWFSSLAILSLWAPVLCLAAYRPTISLIWLAALGAGLLVVLQLAINARKQLS